jgi:hypothetical protein
MTKAEPLDYRPGSSGGAFRNFGRISKSYTGDVFQRRAGTIEAALRLDTNCAEKTIDLNRFKKAPLSSVS